MWDSGVQEVWGVRRQVGSVEGEGNWEDREC